MNTKHVLLQKRCVSRECLSTLLLSTIHRKAVCIFHELLQLMNLIALIEQKLWRVYIM